MPALQEYPPIQGRRNSWATSDDGSGYTTTMDHMVFKQVTFFMNVDVLINTTYKDVEKP